jgi:hypothetical protein
LEHQKEAADYIGKIESSSDPQVRAALIRSVDIVTDPEKSVRIAFQYAYPNKNNGENPVADAAIGVLKRERHIGYDELLDILKQENVHNVDQFNQAEMVSAIVKNRDDRFFIRVSDIDDYVQVNLNGQFIDNGKWNEGNDSGWIDLTNKIKYGANQIEFIVINSPYEGCGGHFQISAGIQQYDYSVYLTACPANRAAFRIDYAFKVLRDGQIYLQGPGTRLKQYTDWNTCVRGCSPAPQYRDSD